MDDRRSVSGSFWIPDSEIEPVPDPTPFGLEPIASHSLSRAAEGWFAVIAVVAMIGVSDLLMFYSWR